MNAFLMPPGPDVCVVCAHNHPPALPHNLTSIYYQMRFQATRGRAPTWADAAAHCTPAVIAQWKDCMRQSGVEWTEPTNGEAPIADPPAESFNHCVEVPIEVVEIQD